MKAKADEEKIKLPIKKSDDDFAKDKKVDMREVAYILALKKVTEALEIRGVYP